MQIEGEIIFSEESASFNNATVIIKVEDVRYADASATVSAEQRLTNISRLAGSTKTLPFNLEFTAPSALTNYSLRVHVDLDQDGQVSCGDFVTTQSYPLNKLLSFARIIVHPVK